MKNDPIVNNPVQALFDEVAKILSPVVDGVCNIINNIAREITMSLRAEPYERYQMRKWLTSVPNGAIVGNEAVLVVYNSEAPELSYIIKEPIEI